MKELIKQILREEAEVKEMGLSLSKLKAAQPKNYLVKSLKDREKTAGFKSDMKKLTQKCNKLYSEISNDLKNMKWEDVILTEHDKFFYFMLPPKIKTKMFQMCEAYHELDVNKYLSGLAPIDRIKQMCSDYDNFVYKEHIYLYIDYPRNRTHFPEGLPKSLLGYNLGYKIYRKLLNRIKFIQSKDNASKDVQEVYRKLMQAPDINAIVYKDRILLIEDGVPKEKVIEILNESLYEWYSVNSSRKLILGKTILVSSKLQKLIGKDNLLSMLNDWFYKARHEDREPFQKIGYVTKGVEVDLDGDEYDEDEYDDDEYSDYDFEEYDDEEEDVKK